LFGEAPLPARTSNRTRAGEHLLTQLVCLGTHTVTGLLSACGRQFCDWSADYRLYERNRVDPEALFAAVRGRLLAKQTGAVVCALDDTRIKKTGTKTHGVQYTRDPLGPPFHLNLFRAQRFLQISMALQADKGEARMVPVDWVHAPLAPKPKKNAPAQAWEHYRMQRTNARIGITGAQRLLHLRVWLDENDARERELVCVADGSFTNATVLKNLPERTTLIGRIRSDAKLYYVPAREPAAKGRRRCYGEIAPTPEQLRTDDAVPWQPVEVFYGGKTRELRAKRLGPLRWRTAGGQTTLQLVVLAPTPYRLTKNSRLLYRKPAYLICTDPDAPLAEIIQHYLWRWDIEVNFRDQKTLLGLGDAQVRTKNAIQNLTGTAVAAYAMLLTAADDCRQTKTPCQHLPQPKWRRQKQCRRATTMDLIQNLRYELWARALHFSDFEYKRNHDTKPRIRNCPLESALFYASTYS
jgi:hypothetical protein